VAVTDLSYSRQSPDNGMLTVATTRVRWFEAVYFTSPLTMEYLQKFKPQKHVLVEDQRLIDLADAQLKDWKSKFARK
jgi:hypothetical protein